MGIKGTYGYILLATLGLLTSFEVNAAPAHLTYQGRIVKPNGEPLQHHNVSFLFEITSPNGACVLYREQVDGINMQNSNGVFDVSIVASHSYPASPTFTVLDAFNNSGSLTCSGGAPFSATLSSGRLLRVQFHDGTSWKLISPDTTIRSVPYSGYSESSSKLGSYLPEDFVRKAEVNGGSSCQTGSFLTWDAISRTFGCAPDSTSGGGGTLTTLNGQTGATQTFSPASSATSYGFSSASNVHTLSIPSASTAGVTSGTISKSEYDTFNSKQAAGSYITTMNGDVTSSGFSAGAVTTTIGNNAVTTAKVADGAITGTKLENSGVSAGTYSVVSVDAKGRVISGGTLSATDIPNLDASKITTGTLTRDVSASNVAATTGTYTNLRIYDGVSQYLTMRLPTGGTGYTLNWPNAMGANGSVLQTDASGNLSWVTVPSAPVTSVAGKTGIVTLTNTDISGLGTASTKNVPATGDAAAAEVVLGNDSRLSGPRAPNGSASGDLSGNYPGPTVAKIQNRAIDATAPLDGQVLLWDNGNTTWKPQYVRAQDLRTAWGGTQMIPSTACAANETMVWSVITDRFTCQAIGSLSASAIASGTIAAARLGSGTADSTTYLRGDGTWQTISTTDATKLPLAGGTMTGDVNMGGHKITNVSNVPFVAANPTGTEDGKTLRWNNTAGQWEWFTAGAAGAGIGTLNGQTGTTQSFAPTSSATSYGFSSATNVHTLSIPSASTAGVTAGTISKTEYDAFNAKQTAGNYITTLSGDVTSSGFSAGTVTTALANNAVTTGKILDGAVTGAKLEDVSGLTAGTYPNVTVDAKGRVTSGTTLSATDIPNLDAAKITTGVLATGRLGTGTADNTKFLRGDGTWQSVSITETDPKVGANTTNYLSKWNGTALVASTVIESSGSVGIGTATPGNILDVQKNQGATTYVSVRNTNAGGGAGTSYYNDQGLNGEVAVAGSTAGSPWQNRLNLYTYPASGGINIATSGAGDDIRFFTDTSTEAARILSSGNFGIGTTAPGAKLEVAGQVKITGGSPGAGKVLTSDAAGLATWQTPAAGGSGTVTGITAGTGLTGGTITTSGTIGLGTELTGLAGLGTTGFVKRIGAGAYSTSSSVALTSDVTGVLPIANGGTNSSTALNNNRLMASVSGAIQELGALGDGQVVVGKNASAPQVVTLGGDATISNTGSLTIGTGAVTTGKILDGTVGVADLNFAGTMTTNTGIMVRDGTQFYNKSCSGNQTLIWSVANGWICSSVTLTETDPKVGTNTTNYMSKWNGSALVASGMIEDASGNIGIGTTTPTKKLHVEMVSNSTAAQKVSSGMQYIYSYPSTSSATTFVGLISGAENGATGAITGELIGQISYADNGGSGALNKISASWNGVKNTSTGGTVATAIGAQGSVENASANAITTAMALNSSVIKSGAGAITNAYGLYIGGIAGTNPWSIYASDATAPSYFAGNIGIGITVPTSKLEITGGSAAVDTSYILNRTNASSTKYVAGEIKTWAYNNNAGSEDTSILLYSKMAGSTGLAAEFGAENYLNTETYFDGKWSYFRRGGNDTYGAWIYGTKYRGTYASKTAVLANDDMLNLGAEGFYNGTSTNFGSYITFQAAENYTSTAAGSRIIFGTVANGTTTQTARMTIENTGNVAIGMSPGATYKFQVNGSVAGVGAYNATSDQRLKRNIASYENGLETVLKLRGVTFDWRRDEYPQFDFDGTHDVGVIAQEVEKVVPEAVHTADDGFKTVAYSKLISPIIQAIHELYERWLSDHKKIEQQQVEINRLKAELESQKKDMQEIKALLGKPKRDRN